MYTVLQSILYTHWDKILISSTFHFLYNIFSLYRKYTYCLLAQIKHPAPHSSPPLCDPVWYNDSEATIMCGAFQKAFITKYTVGCSMTFVSTTIYNGIHTNQECSASCRILQQTPPADWPNWSSGRGSIHYPQRHHFKKKTLKPLKNPSTHGGMN